MSPPTLSAVMLVTGEYFDHLAPDPSVINLDVLEHGLDVPRFNNQTTRPITVLEHSLRVRRIVVELWNGSDVDLGDLSLRALLHDAHEAILPWGDCLRPGKTQEMRDVEAIVDTAILSVLAPLGLTTGRITQTVKTADNIALYFEAMLWQPGAIDWAPDVMTRVWEDLRGPNEFRSSMVERFMPLITPRPRECWRTEVETLLETMSS